MTHLIRTSHLSRHIRQGNVSLTHVHKNTQASHPSLNTLSTVTRLQLTSTTQLLILPHSSCQIVYPPPYPHSEQHHRQSPPGSPICLRPLKQNPPAMTTEIQPHTSRRHDIGDDLQNVSHSDMANRSDIAETKGPHQAPYPVCDAHIGAHNTCHG